MKVTFKIKKVDCANCAAKIEDKIKKLSGLNDVNYNFMSEKLTFHCDKEILDLVYPQIEEIVHSIEPDAHIERHAHHHHEEHCDCGHEHHHHHDEHCNCGHEHHHHHEEHCNCDHEHHHHHEEHCNCGHEHHHHHEEHCDCGHEHHELTERPDLKQKYSFVIEGLDCANCAAKVERHLNHSDQLSDVQILFFNKTIKLNSNLSGQQLKNYLQSKVDEVEDGVQICDVNHTKEKHVEKKRMDSDLVRIVVSAIVLVLGFMTSTNTGVSLMLFALSYLLSGYDILLRAVRNIRKGQIFDENFLMAIATIGAIVVSEYAEACAVMVFYQVGEYFQNRAVEKSRRSIAELMDICPDEARVERHGQLAVVSPEDVQLGEILVVRAGEKVPLDGVVVEGQSSLDTRALTGESRYQSVEENDEILSGVINVDGVLRIRVTKPYHDSTVARILELVENAGSRKAPAEAFITRFAKVYTPFVCLMALLIAVVPPILIEGAVWMDYLYRACTFLVISCPCALVVSVPLSYFAGIGGLSSQGILVKGGNYLDALNRVNTYVFDKTGTLTEGNFELTKVLSEHPEKTCYYAACAEQHSNHPIAKSILAAYHGELGLTEDVHEIAGCGIVCRVDGKMILAGNEKLMKMHQVEIPALNEAGTLIHVCCEREYLGTLLIQDKIRSESKKLIQTLKQMGKKTVMLTGDQKSIAQYVADELKVDEFHAELLPDEKVAVVENMIAEGDLPAFTGDGINDAPVLAMSSVGFAMGGIGSDAAIEAADIVIMNDSVASVLKTLNCAVKTRRIVVENIYGALFVKFVILLLGALGMAGMWAAVFADVGVAVLAILNAIRAMK